MAQLTTSAWMRRTASRTWRPTEEAIWRRVLRVADALVMLTPYRCDPARVLLVRLDNIGDFVLWLDAARALVAHYRGRGLQVSLLASASWAEFARELGVFDEVLAVQQERFKGELGYRRRLLRYLRAAGFAVAVQPTRTRVPEMGDAVVRVSGAAERVGVALHDEGGVKVLGAGRGGYTRLVVLEPGTMGELRANAAFVRELTGVGYRARVADLGVVAEASCMDGLKALVPAGRYVVLFPGASEAGKRWPLRSFRELAMRCREEMGCDVLICGGPGDIALAEAIARDCGEGVRSLAGKTTLKQLAAVIAGAEMLVSNDTAAVHLAAAAGVPSVCIAGGGHYGRFLPYEVEVADERPLPVVATQPMECFGCNWRCRYHPAKGEPMPCVEGVTVDAVWALAASLVKPRVEETEACLS